MQDAEILAVLHKAHEYAVPTAVEARKRIGVDAALSDLGVDSMSAMEMVGFIEDEMGIELPDDEISKINGVGDFVAVIRKHLPEVLS